MDSLAESALPFVTSIMNVVAMSRTIERNLASNLVIVIPLPTMYLSEVQLTYKISSNLNLTPIFSSDDNWFDHNV